MEELWKLETGWLAGYTEDKATMQRIKRYKTNWRVMAEYVKDGKIKAIQYRIPMKERRQAEHVFQTKLAEI